MADATGPDQFIHLLPATVRTLAQAYDALRELCAAERATHNERAENPSRYRDAWRAARKIVEADQ